MGAVREMGSVCRYGGRERAFPVNAQTSACFRPLLDHREGTPVLGRSPGFKYCSRVSVHLGHGTQPNVRPHLVHLIETASRERSHANPITRWAAATASSVVPMNSILKDLLSMLATITLTPP